MTLKVDIFGDKETTVQDIYNELERINHEINRYKEYKAEAEKSLYSMFQKEIEAAYKQKSEPFGAVSFKDSGLDITFTTPKNVTWDQKGLEHLYYEGAPVDVDYSMKETTFKELNDAGRAALMPFRTVKPGSISIKIKETK